MRHPVQDKEQLRRFLDVENRRLPDLKQAVEDAEKANDLKSYRTAKAKYDDCMEEILHLENKLHPYR